MTHASLFIPCLVEQFMPEAGEAAARVLARAGVRVDCPRGQTCCGQPLYKSGHGDQARALALRFLRLFAQAEAVVAPSGSCVHMVRAVYPGLLADDPAAHAEALALGARTFELTEFLVRRLGVTDLGAHFAGTVAYHDSCQVGRALGVRAEPLALLRAVKGLTLAEVADADQCCGFGGPFAVQFETVSAALLGDKLDALAASGATALTAAEPSCLLHLRGGLQKRGLDLPVVHIAQILASEAP
ncbi:(Fe-S)-binding protein [Desulfocurvus vexinensis]|uniref:(Fe-S)-binding protein n=1 Tax=Desulfocurvus vexinensis TaxID=399548 RepID=UPI00048F2914|nr:(Fe-S)-binding protein [Desulfocurvus vexinensis]